MSQNTEKSTPQKKRRPPKKITPTYLENAGLYYLGRYSSSTANFRRVMKRKIDRSARHHEQEADQFYPMLEELITRYQSSGLLNDAIYSFAKVRALRQRGNSERMIHAKLSQKGLSAEEISAALEKHAYEENAEDTSATERAAAEKYARKRRLGPYRMPPDPERYDKDMAAMARAGFSFDIVKLTLGTRDDLVDF